ncbi:MAG: sulfotransferase [Leptospirales bacterium]
MSNEIDTKVAFIVGSPRSGTTILGEILNEHPRMAQWYEPYFIWDKHFRNAENDRRTPEDAEIKVVDQIRKDFSRYAKNRVVDVVIDKSPRNSLTIEFILEIFPNAKFIHILRDGRDVTSSIHREWNKRISIFNKNNREQKFDYKAAFLTLKTWLDRQPFLRDKLRAFWHETNGHLFNKGKTLNRTRWHGRVGWGPRYQNWEEDLISGELIEFNARQWLNCVDSIFKSWPKIKKENKLLIRYENMLINPEKTLSQVTEFLGLEPCVEVTEAGKVLRPGNTGKWAKDLSSEDVKLITPIIKPMLKKIGY